MFSPKSFLWIVAKVSAGLLLVAATVSSASGQVICDVPAAFEEHAFTEPMTFTSATSKGNMSTSVWISATGVIGPETPDRFARFLQEQDFPPSNVVFHSPGGNLIGGLELGRMIRERSMTTHIGRTDREFLEEGTCRSWADTVYSGLCASSCAYAFLGGETRFVESEYYPTDGNLIGFHQFYGETDRGAEMLSETEVSEIKATTLSTAQVITGEIVLYALEMGIDPRIVAFAAATPSDDLYFPAPSEIVDLNIATGRGLGAWFMEPYADGLVAAARPLAPDSMLQQVTAFCDEGDGKQILISMDLVTPSYPKVENLPLNGVEIQVDGVKYNAARSQIDVRYNTVGDTVLIAVPVSGIANKIGSADHLRFNLDAPRVMGNFFEGGELDDMQRKAIRLAWRNCI